MDSLIDTHCHLDLPDYDQDREEVVNRAHTVGVNHFIVPGITIKTGDNLVRTLANYPDISFAFGLHPNYANEWDQDSLAELKSLASNQGCVAIGEIGLDYYRHFVEPEIQRRVFQTQLSLAAELELPVIIHCREAEADLCSILQSWHDTLIKRNSPLAAHPGVLHAFSGSTHMLDEFSSRNFYFGIGGSITFKNDPERVSLIRSIPSECILLETDAPYLTPTPFRGKRNEPSYLIYISEKLAEIRNQSVTELSNISALNSKKLYIRE